jgi:membrane glycosyltransferase
MNPDLTRSTSLIRDARAEIVWLRRLMFWTLVTFTFLGTMWLAVAALSPLDVLDILMLVLFAVTLPWNVIGFWNALIGFLIMRFARDPVGLVTPVALDVRGDEPINSSTAILLTIRNEHPDRVFRNLERMMEGLIERGVAHHFHAYLLSDTNRDDIAHEEEQGFGDLKARYAGRMDITYRRRTSNEGFKAGNVREFLVTHGWRHEFALTLDADSIMSADAILRLVRTIQADDKLGLVQSLVVGLPSTSLFARVFQFGMRLGMRSYTIGSAWWQADCGPYWGHNAIVRIAPFRDHGVLPPIPGNGPLSGPILSHDQVEAVLIRKAGYEVRALPVEDGSWEENPTTFPEFFKRDLRWCQGNMQYLALLGMDGIKPVSRYQFVFAIIMFLGSPAWFLLYVLAFARLGLSADPSLLFNPGASWALFWLLVLLIYAPKLATVVDVLTNEARVRSFGGRGLFLRSLSAELVFTLLVIPVMVIGHTRFLFGLAIGKPGVGWNAQLRDDMSVPWGEAAKAFALPTLVGALGVLWLLITVPGVLPYALPSLLALLLPIPIAVWSSDPRAGRWAARTGLGRLPEEVDPPADFASMDIEAIKLARGLS